MHFTLTTLLPVDNLTLLGNEVLQLDVINRRLVLILANVAGFFGLFFQTLSLPKDVCSEDGCGIDHSLLCFVPSTQRG